METENPRSGMNEGSGVHFAGDAGIHSNAHLAAPALRLLARYDRRDIEGFLEVAIGLLDLADGDADVEPNGNELDGNLGEDDFCTHSFTDGPGCPVSDGDSEHDGRETDDGV